MLGEKQMRSAEDGLVPRRSTTGSTEPTQFIVLQYRARAAKAAPVVLVGKGVTFDTGAAFRSSPAKAWTK